MNQRQVSQPPLLTYLGDPTLKQALLAEIAKHEAADVIRGRFRGCAIGCALHSLNIVQGKVGPDAVTRIGNHARFEQELGIPRWLSYLVDHIFENIGDPLIRRAWLRRVAQAIPVGVTVDQAVLADILVWILTDPTWGVVWTTDRQDMREWIRTIAAYVAAEARGTATSEQQQEAAEATWVAWDARATWDDRAAVFTLALSDYVVARVAAIDSEERETT